MAKYLHFAGTSYNTESDFYLAVLEWYYYEIPTDVLQQVADSADFLGEHYRDFWIDMEQNDNDNLLNPPFNKSIFQQTLEELILVRLGHEAEE